MPALGFLKKIRTKEAPGTDGEPITPTATNASNTIDSPTTPTVSNYTKAGTAPLEPQKQPPLETPLPATTLDQNQTNSSTNDGVSMSPGANYQQYTTAPQAQPPEEKKQHYLPHIHNLIHPTQHDNTGQTNLTAPMATQPNQIAPTSSEAITLQQPTQVRSTKGKYSLSDFEIRRTLGTGSFGRVHLVQSKHNQRYYAVKVLKKTQVVKMKQVEHTNDERKMLQEVKHPFLITLWGTFQDSRNIYMVMDFVEGGELFSLLRKSQASKVVLATIIG
jgi:protein kinase A